MLIKLLNWIVNMLLVTQFLKLVKALRYRFYLFLRAVFDHFNFLTICYQIFVRTQIIIIQRAVIFPSPLIKQRLPNTAVWST